MSQWDSIRPERHWAAESVVSALSGLANRIVKILPSRHPQPLLQAGGDAQTSTSGKRANDMTHFFYLRHPKTQQPVVTFAYTTHMTDSNDEVVLFNYSVHNPNDKFNRKLGRDVAEGRMRKHPYQTFVWWNSVPKSMVKHVDAWLTHLHPDDENHWRLRKYIDAALAERHVAAGRMTG